MIVFPTSAVRSRSPSNVDSVLRKPGELNKVERRALMDRSVNGTPNMQTFKKPIIQVTTSALTPEVKDSLSENTYPDWCSDFKMSTFPTIFKDEEVYPFTADLLNLTRNFFQHKMIYAPDIPSSSDISFDTKQLLELESIEHENNLLNESIGVVEIPRPEYEDFY